MVSKIDVSPNPSMYDEKVCVKAEGLNPNCIFTFHTHLIVEKGDAFECIAHYMSDNEGKIDVTKDRSVGGFYKGVESMGLFWGLKPSPKNKRDFAMPIRSDTRQPLEVRIRVYPGQISSLAELDLHDHLAETWSTRLFMAPGVRRIVVRENGLHGVLFLPPGDGPFPGVLKLDGVVHNIYEVTSASLASRGFAAFTLAYFGMEGLPNLFHDAKIEYFDAALKFLLQHEKVDKTKGVGIFSECFSVPFALSMATHLKEISCVICVNGPLPPKRAINQVVSISEAVQYFKTNLIEFREFLSHKLPRSHTEAKSRILEFYKRHDVAFMFVGSLDDGVIPSEYFTNVAERFLKEENHPNYEIHRYPGAGHLLKLAYLPHNYISFFKTFRAFCKLGGVSSFHCKAEEDIWQKELQFLRKNLT